MRRVIANINVNVEMFLNDVRNSHDILVVKTFEGIVASGKVLGWSSSNVWGYYVRFDDGVELKLELDLSDFLTVLINDPFRRYIIYVR